MQVVINGKSEQLDGVDTVADLVRHLDIHGRIAIEVNRQIVPRSQYPAHRLRDADVIEVVHAVGGG